MSAKRQKIKDAVDEKEHPSPLPPSIADAPWKPEDPVSFESLSVSDKTMWNNIKADIQAFKSMYEQISKAKAVRSAPRSILVDKEYSLYAAVDKLLIKIEQNPTMTTVHCIQHPCLLHTFALSGIMSDHHYFYYTSKTLKKLIAHNPSALLWSERHYENRPFMETLVMSHPEFGSYILQQLPEVFSSSDEELQGLASSVSTAVAREGSREDIHDYFEGYPQGLFMVSDGTPPLMTIISRIDRRAVSEFDRGLDPDGLSDPLMDLIKSFPAAVHEDMSLFLKAELCKVFFRIAVDDYTSDSFYRMECFNSAKFIMQKAPKLKLDHTATVDGCLKILNTIGSDDSGSGYEIEDVECVFDTLVTLLRVMRASEIPFPMKWKKMPTFTLDPPVLPLLEPLIDREVSIAKECIKLRRVSKMMEQSEGEYSGEFRDWAKVRLVKYDGLAKAVRAEIESVRADMIRRQEELFEYMRAQDENH